jgi:ornithine decarboxylase
MTQDAAVLVTEVIGMARRGDEEWVYLDAGVYNGLIDTTEGVVYPLCTADEVRSGRLRPRRRVTLAGPSCDGNDVLMRGVNVPALEIGDRLLFAQAGAYTTAFERFNGLPFPEVVELSA